MPELPEVETTVRGLRKSLIGKKIIGFWTDWPKYFKKSPSGGAFLRCASGRTIKSIERRGKNIIFFISGKHILLIHQKLSGHLMVGRWIHKKDRERKEALIKLHENWGDEDWIPADHNSRFADPKNRFIRLIFFLKGDKMIAFSDLRRFGKVLCGREEDIMNLPDLKDLGPDPLGFGFTFSGFRKIARNRKGEIKKLLLNQSFISGIGNIYADEILWSAKIHPLRKIERVNDSELNRIIAAMKVILKRAIRHGGTSMDDYRHTDGKKGRYEKFLNAYQRHGRECPRCGEKIIRIKTGVRSTHFCPRCQNLS